MKGNPVMVTTEHRGVFFGYEESRKGSVITLSRARMCVSWEGGLKGVLGLAATGPSQHCRVGPAVERLELLGVTAVSSVTKDAIKRWEKEPWG